MKDTHPTLVDPDATLPLSALPPRVDALGLAQYEDLGPIGAGGMGDVRRVRRNRDLLRPAAIRILRADALLQPRQVARFIAEARITAQLQHPAIVPVHELGRLGDGRVYFVMREVRGRTLRAIITALHRASADGSWRPTDDGWTLRRLVDAFHRVCEAVAYAHSRAVLHRDLKPENIMLGAFGEVQVMDWGLAKLLDQPTAEPLAAPWPDAPASMATQPGTIAGTPAYMAPEQAAGRLELLGPHTDVFALGVILDLLLTGRRAYDDTPLVHGATPPEPPHELVEICERARAAAPEDRYRDGSELAEAVGAWLDGARRRAAAERVVARAEDRTREAEALREQAAQLREAAEAGSEALRPWDAEADKREAWALEDAATGLERDAERLDDDVEQLLRGALTHAPTLGAVHEALLYLYRQRHWRAEATRDERGAHRAALRMRAHAEALPADSDPRKRAEAYLLGDGRLTLRTDPPGAAVEVQTYAIEHRRSVPGPARPLGTTPLVGVPLPRGSHLLTVRHPERVEVVLPVAVGREEHVERMPPGAGAPELLLLPRTAPSGARFVAAGWFASGGDPEAFESLPARRLWIPAFWIDEHPVTHGAFRAFLDDLVHTSRSDEAARHAPRDQGGDGGPVYVQGDAGFSLPEGLDEDVPVTMIDWYAARAFAAWRAERTGQPWRLPTELEWEKAARGADGRHLPWGDQVDPSWCHIRGSYEAPVGPVSIHAFAVDCSPHGVRGLAGNVRDWCADLYAWSGPDIDGLRMSAADEREPAGRHHRSIRGGAWTDRPRLARAASRFRHEPGYRSWNLGFRLACDLSPSAAGPSG